MLKLKISEGDVMREKSAYEKGKLEAELKQTSKEYTIIQNDFQQLQQELKKVRSDAQTSFECKRLDCKRKYEELDSQHQKKMQQVYDLTVRLGCIDQENKELTNQLKNSERHFEIKLESQRELAEQDIADASN